jgi:hypothetical protein
MTARTLVFPGLLALAGCGAIRRDPAAEARAQELFAAHPWLSSVVWTVVAVGVLLILGGVVTLLRQSWIEEERERASRIIASEGGGPPTFEGDDRRDA